MHTQKILTVSNPEKKFSDATFINSSFLLTHLHQEIFKLESALKEANTDDPYFEQQKGKLTALKEIERMLVTFSLTEVFKDDFEERYKNS
jgi:hypothetical protein